MSYLAAVTLQQALWDCLSAAPELAGVVIGDALPPGPAPQTWVVLGAEEVRDASDASGAGAWHRIEISVLSRAAGFAEAKAVAEQIGAVLLAPEALVPDGAGLVGLWFERARARRLEGGALRRIDLTFRVRLDLGQH